jgi:hypothetical protein
MCVDIVEDDAKFTIREGGNEAVHEAEELHTTAPLGMHRDDPSGGDFERCEQSRSAMPLVVEALPGQTRINAGLFTVCLVAICLEQLSRRQNRKGKY